MSAGGKKSKRSLIQLTVAILVAGVCAIGSIVTVYGLFVSYADSQEQVSKKATQEVADLKAQLEQVKNQKPVLEEADVAQVQAIVDIPVGEPVSRSQVELVSVHKADAVPAGAQSLNDVLGRVAIAPIANGTFITTNQLSRPTSVSQLPVGYRAIAISVDSVGGIAGGIMPGAFVDVLVTAAAKPSGMGVSDVQPVTKTLLQRIRVIEVARSGGAALTRQASDASNLNALAGASNVATDGPSLVTLAVQPKQAEMLALAQQMGKFHLALRGYDDKLTITSGGSRWQQIVAPPGSGKPAAKLAAFSAKAPPLPSFEALMGQSGMPGSNAGMTVTSGTPYQMEVVKGANSEWVTLQAK